MKRLLLIRHAKASWKNPEISDFERPLTTPGEQEVKQLAEALDAKEILPHHLVASPAARALLTAQLLADAFHYPKKSIVTDPGIYEASLSTLVEILQGLDPAWRDVWVVGHNPGLTELCSFLSPRLTPELSTGSAIYFELPVQKWARLRSGQGRVLSQINL